MIKVRINQRNQVKEILDDNEFPMPPWAHNSYNEKFILNCQDPQRYLMMEEVPLSLDFILFRSEQERRSSFYEPNDYQDLWELDVIDLTEKIPHAQTINEYGYVGFIHVNLDIFKAIDLGRRAIAPGRIIYITTETMKPSYRFYWERDIEPEPDDTHGWRPNDNVITYEIDFISYDGDDLKMYRRYPSKRVLNSYW